MLSVPQLNYEALRTLGLPWVNFPSVFAERPVALSAANATARFRALAAHIISDMDSSRGLRPWVLKDVRFARTLPLWHPLLHRRPIACLVPLRHPVEVASSSRMRSLDRLQLWRNYLISALVSARAIDCPTMLVPYAGWVGDGSNGSAVRLSKQVARLHRFLSCAGIRGLPSPPPEAAIINLIRPVERHKRAEALPALPTDRSGQMASCLWEALRRMDAASGARGLDWPRGTLCGTDFRGVQHHA